MKKDFFDISFAETSNHKVYISTTICKLHLKYANLAIDQKLHSIVTFKIIF